MESRCAIGARLDRLFRIDEWEADPFRRFIPMVYDPLGFDWTHFFEPDFVKRFNGFMLSGRDEIRTVFLAVFPTNAVLQSFIDQSEPGDLLFMHHPLFMECGDPQGTWGRGFLPISLELLHEMKAKELSVYTCHLPMDTNLPIGTGGAILEALEAEMIRPFLPFGNGHIGMICRIQETNTAGICDRLRQIFDIPYVDFEGKTLESIHTIAIVPGCGDVVRDMQEAEALGAQAYITGEIHCHIDNPYGRQRFAQMMEYVPESTMSLIGVSHAASEYLVMKTQMKRWFEQHTSLRVVLLPQETWWM